MLQPHLLPVGYWPELYANFPSTLKGQDRVCNTIFGTPELMLLNLSLGVPDWDRCFL